MKTPDHEALSLAAEWLLQYDDEDFGGSDTKRLAEVADWLYAQAYAAELRGIAREMGIPVSKIRAAIIRADCS